MMVVVMEGKFLPSMCDCWVGWNQYGPLQESLSFKLFRYDWFLVANFFCNAKMDGECLLPCLIDACMKMNEPCVLSINN